MKTDYISDPKRISEIIAKIQSSHSWVAFDCEFKKNSEYDKELSIITLCTESNLYIFDFLLADFLPGFSALLANNNIQKITHAGQSDYDIFYRINKTLPQNTIDTQILAIFASRNLPQSLSGLVEMKFGKILKKENAATNWIERPLSKSQLEYAAQDVIYLKKIADALMAELAQKNRLEWALNECRSLENKDRYSNHELKEILSRRELSKLSKQEFIFIIRLIKWQSSEKKVNESDIYKKRLISDLLRVLPAGKAALINDTRISKSRLAIYFDEIIDLYMQEPSSEETDMYEEIIPNGMAKEKRNNALDILYSVIDNICINNDISTRAILTKSDLTQIKNIREYVDYHFSSKYLIDFLGEGIVTLLKRIDDVVIVQEQSGVKIHFKEGR
jgi:ribonuclease D